MEDPRVTIELINDGFHVQDPMVKLGFEFAPHRTAFVTDAMAATDCPDGPYKLGASWTVNASTATPVWCRTVQSPAPRCCLRSPCSAPSMSWASPPVDASRLPRCARARVRLRQAERGHRAPLGLLAPGYAADLLLTDPSSWTVNQVWCAGRKLK
mgnify:CR=1 FL=1